MTRLERVVCIRAKVAADPTRVDAHPLRQLADWIEGLTDEQYAAVVAAREAKEQPK